MSTNAIKPSDSVPVATDEKRQRFMKPFPNRTNLPQREKNTHRVGNILSPETLQPQNPDSPYYNSENQRITRAILANAPAVYVDLLNGPCRVLVANGRLAEQSDYAKAAFKAAKAQLK